MTTPRRLRGSAVTLLLATLTVAACAATAAPPASPTPGPSQPPTAAPPASANDLPTSDPGAGGGSSGNTGSGVVDPGVPVDPNDPGTGGQAQLVRPRAGQKDPHPVAPTKLEASVDGRHVLVKVSWYSGVEPCNVLDSVTVEKTGTDISITPFEGMGDPGAMCIEIAVLKATIVDLGELGPGTYRILAPTGDAAPLELTIS